MADFQQVKLFLFFFFFGVTCKPGLMCLCWPNNNEDHVDRLQIVGWHPCGLASRLSYKVYGVVVHFSLLVQLDILEGNSSVVFLLKTCHTRSLEFLICWKTIALLYFS